MFLKRSDARAGLTGIWAAVVWVFVVCTPNSAMAVCVQNGQTVTCDGLDFDGFLTAQSGLTLNIADGALVRNIQTQLRRGNCPLSLPAVSLGGSSAVSNAGKILTFGVCATGIEAGASSLITNDGIIVTDDILAYGIQAGTNSMVINSGSILTKGISAAGLFLDTGATFTNTESGVIQTNASVSSGIFVRGAANITTNGLIQTSGQGSHGIDSLSGGVISNTGRIEVSGFQSVGIRSQSGSATVLNTGQISGSYTGQIDPNNPEDGIQARSTEFSLINTGAVVMASSLSVATRVEILGIGNASVNNTGTLSAPSGGLSIRASEGHISVTNSGLISATDFGSAAIFINSGDNGRSTFVNGGRVAAGSGAFSYLGGRGQDEIINNGTMTGRIALEAGNDRITLQGGTVLDDAEDGGVLDGGSGNDELVMTGSGSLNASVVGFEELTKFGNGQWVLEHGSSVNGRTRIIEGEFTIRPDVTLVSDEITIFSEGTLRLSGEVEGNLENQGVLIVSSAANVSGSFIQADTGLLTVATDATDHQLGSFLVSGTASLSGRLLVDTSQGPLIVDDTVAPIVTAGSLTGSISDVTIAGSSFLTAEALLDPNSLAIRFTRTPFASVSLSPNGRALAAAIDTEIGSTDPAATSFIRSIDSLTPKTAGAAFDSLATSLPLALTEMSLLSARDTAIALVAPQPRDLTAIRSWANFGRHHGSFDGATDGRLRQHRERLSVGIDIPIKETLNAGMSITSFKATASSRQTTARAHEAGILFAARIFRRWGSWTGRASAAFGNLNGETDRLSGLSGYSPTRGESNGRTTAAAARIGRTVSWKSWSIQTDGGLSYAKVSRKSFAETGRDDTTLRFDRFSESSMRGDVALSSQYTIGPISPRLVVGVSHNFHDMERQVGAALAVLPDARFNVSIRPEKRSWIEFELTAPYKPRPGVEFALSAGGVLNDSAGGRFFALIATVDW